jgi:hypothetical protein
MDRVAREMRLRLREWAPILAELEIARSLNERAVDREEKRVKLVDHPMVHRIQRSRCSDDSLWKRPDEQSRRNRQTTHPLTPMRTELIPADSFALLDGMCGIQIHEDHPDENSFVIPIAWD